MRKIKCLLVDDEPPAIELLETYIDMIDQLEIVGRTHSAVKAFDMLKELQIDLMFLDIQMPVLNGIDFIKTLVNPPAIILTTAYREYALDGYDLDIVDYLLKPIPFDRFLKAVDRFRSRPSLRFVPTKVLKEKEGHVYFNINKTKHKVFLNEISYLESLKDYVKIHLVNSHLVVKGNLGTILKMLPEDSFLRVHRSFVVSLEKITSFNQSGVNLKTINIPIGNSYKALVMKRISM